MKMTRIQSISRSGPFVSAAKEDCDPAYNMALMPFIVARKEIAQRLFFRDDIWTSSAVCMSRPRYFTPFTCLSWQHDSFSFIHDPYAYYYWQLNIVLYVKQA